MLKSHHRCLDALLVALLAVGSWACGGAQRVPNAADEPSAFGDDDADEVETGTPNRPVDADVEVIVSGEVTIGGEGVLRVYFIDVGQGDGVLVITPNERTILIDAGPSDAGDAVVGTLRRLGVERINLMVTSHAHSDHIGGFEDVLDHFEVLRYADPGFEHTSSVYIDLLERVLGAGIDAYALGAGQWLQVDDEVELLVLAPPDPYLTGTRSDVNSNSIVLLLRFREVEILFTGDAEADTEIAMLSQGLLEDVDVLKVAHHGGGYSTTNAFLEVVRPEYAVISCGEGNSYGHPDPETLERLEGYVHEQIYRTDVSGTITLETDGEHIVVVPESELVPVDEPIGVWVR